MDVESVSIWLAAGKELCHLMNIPFSFPSVNVCISFVFYLVFTYFPL